MLPPTVPRVTPELAQSARDHFQPLYAEPQTLEDGREMATNVLGFFGVLLELRARKAAAPPPPSPPAPVSGLRRRLVRPARPAQE
ncbi:MAG: hypothetical protein V4850_21120 [Myxococcota bacterium]